MRKHYICVDVGLYVGYTALCIISTKLSNVYIVINKLRGDCMHVDTL